MGATSARAGKRARASRSATHERPHAPSLLVGVGGSAGSLRPLEALLGAVGACKTISVLVMTHRDPSMKGLDAILGRATRLVVREATNGDQLERGVVYVLPADKRVTVKNDRLELRPQPRTQRSRAPINDVFRAIATARHQAAVGVVLSGMGEDGAAGLATIKEELGVCLVQSPASAEFDSMPNAAIATGFVDVVADPVELGARIVDFAGEAAERVAASIPKETFETVLAVVRARTGHDFRHYKRSTVSRRIERRMSLRRVSGVPDYVTLLEQDSTEVERLIGDLLISVTQFFRDAEVFEALAEAIERRLRARPRGPVRAWVAGCATGEEAYTLAMILRERWDEIHPGERPEVQIYATDLDGEAIERARHGRYPAAIAADVSPARLARFFDDDNGGYRVKKALRETIVFAKHNLICDPPFTRLDVLTCRNVLIYLDLELQRRLMPVFAYALAPGGILALGLTETMTGLVGTLVPTDPAHKLFERGEATSTPALLPLAPAASGDSSSPARPAPPPPFPRSNALPESITRAIVERVAPPVIVVDAKGELVFASQRMGRFFEQPTGRSSVNVFAMAKDGLAIPLRAAIGKAIARQAHVVQAAVPFGPRGGRIDISAWPLEGTFAGSALVAFNESSVPKASAKKRRADEDGTAAELGRTKGHLEALMQEMSESQDLLRGSNEDLQVLNEELQSANEELTTSKEEMQSMNEELLTLNAELQSTNEQLVTTNDDMRNLLNSTQIPTLFLDKELRLKRFTGQAGRIARVITSDIGRPVTDLRWNIEYATLAQDVAAVLQTLVFKEAEVRANDGSVFTMRIHPYRTVDDVIDGVVMTFLETTKQKRELDAEIARARRELVRRLVERWPGIAYVEDIATGRIEVASRLAARLLGFPRELLVGPTAELWRRLRHGSTPALPSADVELERRDGTRIAMRERTTVLARDEAKEPITVLHVFRRRGRRP